MGNGSLSPTIPSSWKFSELLEFGDFKRDEVFLAWLGPDSASAIIELPAGGYCCGTQRPSFRTHTGTWRVYSFFPDSIHFGLLIMIFQCKNIKNGAANLHGAEQPPYMDMERRDLIKQSRGKRCGLVQVEGALRIHFAPGSSFLESWFFNVRSSITLSLTERFQIPYSSFSLRTWWRRQRRRRLSRALNSRLLGRIFLSGQQSSPPLRDRWISSRLVW